MGRDGQRKKPKASAAVAGLHAAVKQVPAKLLALIDDDSDGRLILRFNQVDVNGPWCLSKATPEQLIQILAAVHDFETMTPLEVFKGYPGKDYLTSDLPNKEARDRLITLGRDDQDISCLRLNGPGRLFGFRRSRYFYVLWWDPDHKIYPSHFKNT